MNSVETVSVEIVVVLGRTTMPINQLLRMGRGAVIELDTDENDEVQLLANNVPVAKGDIVLSGDRIAVSVNKKLTKAQVLSAAS